VTLTVFATVFPPRKYVQFVVELPDRTTGRTTGRTTRQLSSLNCLVVLPVRKAHIGPIVGQFESCVVFPSQKFGIKVSVGP